MTKRTQSNQPGYKAIHGIEGNGGNITVIVALLLPILIGMLAFAADGGHLIMTRGKYENGVEAAALAGAHHFADGYDESGSPLAIGIAKTVAEENGIPEEAIWVEIGYYDEDEAEFRIDTDLTTEWNDAISDAEDPIYNNAVSVTAQNGLPTFFGGIFGKNTVAVFARAVAYGKRYTFVATGTEENHEGIELDYSRLPSPTWAPGYNVFKNCVFRSNGPVSFRGEEYETFINSRIDILEGATVTGDADKVAVVEMSTPLEDTVIDWDALKAQADENGAVYTDDEMKQWPNNTWHTDDYGNHIRRRFIAASYPIYYHFVPAGRDDDDPENTADQGDHEGRTYFFEIPDPLPDDVPGYILHVQNSQDTEDFCPLPYHRTSWNFTIAARCEFSSKAYWPYGNSITLGNVPEEGGRGVVHIYCKGASEQRGWYTNYASWQPLLQPKGVIFYTENDFRMETQYYLGSTEERTFYLRCYAKKIRIWDYYNGAMLVFDGAFGPFDVVRLGKLEESGE